MYWNYSTDFISAETTWNYNRKIVVMWCGLNSETLSLQSTKRKVSPLSILKSSEECQSWDETLHVFDVRHWKELLIAIGRATTMIRRQSLRLRKVFADQLGSIPGPVPFLHPYGLERRSWYVGVFFVLDIIGQDPRWWGNVENPGNICQAVQLYQQCLKVGHSDVHVAVFAYIIYSTN
jgi:hypothetical protein